MHVTVMWVCERDENESPSVNLCYLVPRTSASAGHLVRIWQAKKV